MTGCRLAHPITHLGLTVFVTVFGTVLLMNIPPPPVGNWNRAPVSLINNGYRGLVVAIADGIPEDLQLIEDIKAGFTEASAFLHQATEHRAFFYDLTILVPQSWPDSRAYQPAFTESFDTANVLINTAADRDIPTQPFVKQPGMCGEDGVYLHLTRELILSGGRRDSAVGNLARVIVHEWGHLRWGLFDEYPTGSDDHFYLTSNGTVEPTRCSKAVTGDVMAHKPRSDGETDPVDTGEIQCEVGENIGHLPDPRCRFQPHRDQIQGAMGSLMYAYHVNEITRFCHSNRAGDLKSLHNAAAPTRHNMLCNGRSAWDVMLTTPDFVDGANPPREDAVTEPVVVVKRLFKNRVVFVLDTSSSMNDGSKFEKLLRACAHYLTDTNILPKGTWVALVHFNSTASVLAPLTEIKFESSRRFLVNKLPTRTGGNASIGTGIIKALEVLSSNGDSPAGGVILIMSDGLEDTPPLFNDVTSDVRASGAHLDALAYSSNIDDNFHLPSSGGGGSFFIPFADNDTIATEAPPEHQEDEEFQDKNTFLTIVRRKEMLLGNGNVTNYILIDSTAANNTVFRFTWVTGEARVVVRGPSGALLDPTSPEYSMVVDMEARQVEITIMETAESGEWTYGLINDNDEPQIMKVHVYSTQSDPDVPPLKACASIRQNQVNFAENRRVIIYGDVRQGELPVINATVTALIKRPNDTSNPVTMELFDRGTGPDTSKDDGIYSAYFLDFVGDGVYVVTLQVENKVLGQAKKLTFPQVLSGVMPPNWNETDEPVLVDVDPFMRATAPVEFTVVSSPSPNDMKDDMFPPSRVTDLKIVSVSRDQGSLTLQWTAPGDDYDRGAATRYELRRSNSMEDILSDFNNAWEVNYNEVISGDLSTPQRGGSQETLTIRLPNRIPAESGLLLYLACGIRAIDDAGHSGELSNIVTTMIDYADSTTTAPIATTQQPLSKLVLSTVKKMVSPQSEVPTTVSSTKVNNMWENLGKKMAVVIGVCAFLLLFSTCIILIMACRTRRRSREEADNGPRVSYSKARSARRVSDAWVLEEI